MSVANERFRRSDVFIDYDFEDVMFRYEFGARRCFRKFYGDSHESEVPHDNRLLNDAIRFGIETEAASYQLGKPRS